MAKDFDVHSVTTEHKDATFKDFLKAAFAYATFRPALARAHLRGEQSIFAIDADGKKLFGMSGGSTMTVFTNNDKAPEVDGLAQPECKLNRGGFKL